jgi:hypothetical protein
MSNRLVRLLLACAVLAIPLPVIADPISILNLGRFISPAPASSSGGIDNDNLHGRVEFRGSDGDFVSEALLISSVSPLHFAGHGSVLTSRLNSTGGGAGALAEIFVLFDVAEAQRFEFSSNFHTFGSGGPT